MMRRIDREMPQEFAWEVVDRCEWATIAMTDTENRPYCVPISIARERDALYFHCARQGKKSESLSQYPQVCVSCVGDTCRSKTEFTTEYESAILFGKAQPVTDEEEKCHALYLICSRHTPENMANFESELARSFAATAVWKIVVEQLTGKRKKYDQNGAEMKYGRME